MPKIVALELESFQTIGKRTVIPIRDLTLIFGPNGAGKSAIFDALELIKLITSKDWGEGNTKLLSALHRHSRNSTTETPTNVIAVGIQIEIDKRWVTDELPYEVVHHLDHVRSHSISYDGDHAEDFIGKTLRFYVRFRNNTGKGYSWLFDELSIQLDNEDVVNAMSTASNRCVLTLREREWIAFTELKRLASEKTAPVSLVDSLARAEVESNLGWCGSASSWFSTRYYSNPELEAEFRSLTQDVIDFFKTIVTVELQELAVVGASRTVPKLEESIALIPGDGYRTTSGDFRFGYRIEDSPLLKAMQPKVNSCGVLWLEMCKAVAQSIGVSRTEPDFWDEMTVLQRINSFLREELFIENGYQLNGEVFLIAETDDYGDIPFEDVQVRPKLVRLFLTDYLNRSLEFEDVGSGIGYVLPVLASLARDDISLIQQPELHLHPALQRNLGDIVVKSVENKTKLHCFTIIETHSEHLLLRVMRLIGSAAQREDEVISPLGYERVAILYFDPQPDGETKVRRLRLAPDGQLIDRWPGGFFNERYKDIFGE